MARFEGEISYDIIKKLLDLEKSSEQMIEEMVNAGANVVYENVKRNMKHSFKTTQTLEKGLKKTKTYKTPSDGGINVHVGFYGYSQKEKSKKYPKGVPIPLIAQAREYGTKRGEKKKPFLRKSFNKKQIETEMLKVQEKYLPKDGE